MDSTVMKWISVDDELPFEGEYVLGHFNDSNCATDYCICMFRRGISLADRELLPEEHPHKHKISPADEYGNNLLPYRWSGHFGQDIDYWMRIEGPNG